MTKSITLPPNHELFSDLDLDPEQIESDEVKLGINPAFANRLVGTGDVACVIYPILKDGRCAGMASSPGFVVRLDFELLEKAGFSRDEIYYSLDAEVGRYRDAETGEPVCRDCVLVAEPRARFSDDDPEDWELEDEDDPEAGYRGRLYELLPEAERSPCWSCCAMIDEVRREEA